ncbi:hypothetical protein [Novosphingobium sp. ST904]|uniref:hypothetical protein n=1 Tax=Novosphingobium sp. ST904 TaxID=1684385 RepID=UPI000AD590A5|nr:hypothetical protein [Novosphingobium sp. ST904]TCM34318.1 hypothetical protein EDF59_1182 [Novosphingobium sp. ST904]
MSKTVKEIAEEALPGWKVVARGERSAVSPRVKAQYVTPDIAELRKRYLGDESSPQAGLVPASVLNSEDTEFVEMQPSGSASKDRRRVVIIAGGKAVAVQG